MWVKQVFRVYLEGELSLRGLTLRGILVIMFPTNCSQIGLHQILQIFQQASHMPWSQCIMGDRLHISLNNRETPSNCKTWFISFTVLVPSLSLDISEWEFLITASRTPCNGYCLHFQDLSTVTGWRSANSCNHIKLLISINMILAKKSTLVLPPQWIQKFLLRQSEDALNKRLSVSPNI